MTSVYPCSDNPNTTAHQGVSAVLDAKLFEDTLDVTGGLLDEELIMEQSLTAKKSPSADSM